jgi:hypothetical protein
MKKSVQYILDRNIQCGNSLTSKKMLINKSNYLQDVWQIDSSKINDSIISTSDNEVELVMTQYDFVENKVAIRERTYKNMHEETEQYLNTSDYVEYSMIYTLAKPIIYNEIKKAEESLEDYDF